MIKTILLGGLVVVYMSRFRPKVLDRIRANGFPGVPMLVAEALVLALGLFLVWNQEIEGNVLNYSGVFMYVVGVGIATAARLQLRSNYMPAFSASRPETIVTTGAYAVVRNPVYLGMLLALFGFALVFDSVFAVLSLLTFFLFKIQIKKEEKLLAEVDFARWEKFQDKTRWRLVPFVW